METAEQEILERAKNGDELAFRTIIEKYESRISATVTGILGFSADVDDIGQETFVRFYQSIHRFRGDSSIGTYLTRIAINLSLNELKRRKRKERFRPEDMPGDPPPDPRSGEGDRAADARVVVQRGLQTAGSEIQDGPCPQTDGRLLNEGDSKNAAAPPGHRPLAPGARTGPDEGDPGVNRR